MWVSIPVALKRLLVKVRRNFLTPEGAETFAAAGQRPSCTGSALEVLLAGAVHFREEGLG